MDEAVRFSQVTADGMGTEVSFSLPCGSCAGVITSCQGENDLLVRLMLGLAKPSSGEIRLLGEDVVAATVGMLSALRRRVGVVYPTGGLISNLKAWENLILPLQYFGHESAAAVTERGKAVLERVGYRSGGMELPGHLSLQERRIVGLARAMLTAPRMIVCNEVLGGLGKVEKRHFIDAALAFQREEPTRTLLFISAEPQTVKEIDFDTLVVLKGGNGHD